MQSETGFPGSHQLKSYVAYKSRLKLAARAVLSADAGLLVNNSISKSIITSIVCLYLKLIHNNIIYTFTLNVYVVFCIFFVF